MTLEKRIDSENFERLNQLLSRVESRGLSVLSSEEVLEFGRLYRYAASALSTARSQGVDERRIAYLNQLAARAYGHIYAAEPKPKISVLKFFSEEFPQTFRRNLLFIVISFLICFGAAVFSYAQVRRDPGKADIVMGPGASERADYIAERHTGRKNWMPEEERPFMSSFIITNNIKVTIMAFAFGIAVGIGTILVLFGNGLMLGTIGAVVNSRSPAVALSFWSFVAPHGVIELTAIFIAGGAGLMIGWSLINPGEFTRGDALKLAGREAFKLMLGVAAMLVVAGLIEGFFSPSMTPEPVKLAVAAIIGTIEYTYLFTAGKAPHKS
jgi:uncharacterized membrane protein SpoIIM required for sporulation